LEEIALLDRPCEIRLLCLASSSVSWLGPDAQMIEAGRSGRGRR
jgi:hypothetical protein